MNVQSFDQFEFDPWEGEFWLALAKESKDLRGANNRVKDLSTFFEATEYYPCFSRWQIRKFDTAERMDMASAAEEVIFRLEFLLPCVKKLAGILFCLNVVCCVSRTAGLRRLNIKANHPQLHDLHIS